MATLDRRGRGLAATFFDSLYSSEGVLVPAPGYLAGIAKRCRAAGGLIVADEVQAGFGRSGTHFWGFSAHDIVPDIVTLGKPIGNGHPLAAVVTTRAIAEEFGRRGSYFNTCAGNPVSCVAGMAVLDVIERDGLQARSRDVGSYLRNRLRRLLATHTTIGDIRGSGLFIGIELVSDPETLAPATETARRVVNRLRQRGVLIGRTGPGGNVLKIRPPLVFGRDEADLLVERLVLCLEDEAG